MIQQIQIKRGPPPTLFIPTKQKRNVNVHPWNCESVFFLSPMKNWPVWIAMSYLRNYHYNIMSGYAINETILFQLLATVTC